MTAVELFTESIINIINDAQDNDLNIEFIRDKISIDFKDEFMEMEKQQIIDAYHINPLESEWQNIGIDYYNQTFKTE